MIFDTIAFDSFRDDRVAKGQGEEKVFNRRSLGVVSPRSVVDSRIVENKIFVFVKASIQACFGHGSF